ncbi:MAG: adenylosuccinate lyase family protein, partial [Actinomycetota bacterium]|nr:adenylosuccinate lyase family protein [Actinomycetota bacterium]
MSDCSHERSQIADSRFHGHNYSSPDSRRIFCDDCRIRRWLAVEGALAECQGELGLIPRKAAETIAAAATSGAVDLDAVAEGIRRTSHSLVAVIAGLQDACGPGAGEYVHFGATTQDIQDTGQSLEMRDVLDVVDGQLAELVGRLAELARSERDTLMIGRTHARPALPMTFGLKVASWVDELLRHGPRLDALRERVLVAQLGGGVGTMASFGSAGPQLLAAFAARLGLGAPPVGWHVARDRVAEYVVTLAMLTATLARIAEEVSMLSRPELAELEQGFTHGHVGSSTMPHKRNPEACEQVVVLARLARSAAGLALEAMIGEHERDGRSLRLEWPAVADVSHATLAALAIVSQVVAGLSVRRHHMAAEALRARDLICSEPLMLALAEHVGKQ